MRVALVNDLRMAVEALRLAVLSLPGGEIAWVAENGRQAVENCRRDRPDVILMDMLMPIMDGVEATRQIMQECPCPILVTTASVKDNVGYVYEALGHGAIDAVNTPVLGTGGSLAGAQELLRKISLVARMGPQMNSAVSHPCPPQAANVAARLSRSIVAIGSSTGGPQALREVLAALAKPMTYSVVVVQHLDMVFVPGLCQWLAKETNLPVQQVFADQPPPEGTISLACTADHVVLDPKGRLRYTEEPRNNVYRPSIDVFFASLATAPAGAAVAVLLTGMGRDGACGLKALQQAGWETIVQDEQSSVVWGMPGAAVRMGAANQILPAAEIGPAIDRSLNWRRSNPTT
jgi:two-component system response regulator WspF